MSARYANLPVSNAALERIAKSILERGIPFSWTGLKSVIDQHSYRDLERAMLKAGLLRLHRDDHQESLELTPAGRAILRHYLPRSVLRSPVSAQASSSEKKIFFGFRDEFKVKGVSGDA